MLLFPMVALGGFDLREELGDSTFKASGLEKLSEAELAALSAAVAGLLGLQEEKVIAEQQEIIAQKEELIVRQQQALEQKAVVAAVPESEASLPRGEDRFGLETVKKRVQTIFQSEGPNSIQSRLMGEFTGWNGHTRFELENGQVWRQAEPETFVVRKKINPVVTIRRGMFGSYLLKIEGYNSSCKVERVR